MLPTQRSDDCLAGWLLGWLVGCWLLLLFLFACACAFADGIVAIRSFDAVQKSKCALSDVQSTICQQCHSHCVLLNSNSALFILILVLLFCSVLFFCSIVMVVVALAVVAIAFPLCLDDFPMRFCTTNRSTLSAAMGYGLHFIVIMNARVNHIFHARI